MLLVTAQEMRALDRATIEGGHAAGELLMERAGAGVAAAMERRYGALLGLRVLVLCGAGNNGGDGFVAARHLRARGAVVHVALLAEPGKVTGDARLHLDRLTAATGTAPCVATDEPALARAIATRDHWDFALDALLGTGARGEPAGMLAAGVQALRELDEQGTRVVAVDLPTGVDADTGAIARRAVRADLTVTFAAPKRGHLLYPGRAFAGALEVVDIGLDPAALAAAAVPVTLATPADMAALLRGRDPRAHKVSVGRVLVVGGAAGLTGAVTLAARAAMRAGAGYVQAAVPASLNDVLEVKLTEEMTLPMPETAARSLAASAGDAILRHIGHVDAVALGSGLSRDPDSAALARHVAGTCERPLVLDADGLNAFAGHRDLLERPAPGPRVYTPHLGEMERLTGVPAPELESRRIDAAREWASRWRCVLVLKGAPTVVATPDGRASVNPTGNPALATAGTGDVLTGIIAALLAQRLPAADAARLGAWVHGLAADRIVAARGAWGLVAGDLCEALPSTFAALGAHPARA